MAATKYTYSLAADTINGKVDDKLGDEIGASAITVTFDYIETLGDVLGVWMEDVMPDDIAGESASLLAVVNAHDGFKPPSVQRIESAIDPTVNDDIDSYYAVGTSWVNTTNGGSFILTDNTSGASVWQLKTSKIDITNPDDTIFMLQMNMIRDIFNNDYEGIIGGATAIKNTKLLFFQSDAECSTMSDTNTIDGNLTLFENSIVQKDSMDTIVLEVASESVTVSSTNLVNTATVFVDEPALENLTVKNSAETETYVLGTDFTVDWKNKTLSRIDDSTQGTLTADGGNTSLGSFVWITGKEFELSDSTVNNYKFEIDTAGLRGVATFKWSKDGGSTWEETLVSIPSDNYNHDLDAGMTIKSDCGASDNYVLGDSWTITCTGSSTKIDKGEVLKVWYDRQQGGTWYKTTQDQDEFYYIVKETTNHNEGAGALRISTHNPISNGKKVHVLKTITSEDWDLEGSVRFWVDCTHPTNGGSPELTFQLNDSNEGETFVLPFGPTQVTASILGATRNAVTSYGFKIQSKDSTQFDVVVDDFRLVSATTTYKTSGYAESLTTTLPSTAKELFIYTKDLTDDTNLTAIIKISLDDGTTWYQLTDNDFENWIDATGMAGGTQLKIRVELSTTDTSKTPQFDDIAIAYKL